MSHGRNDLGQRTVISGVDLAIDFATLGEYGLVPASADGSCRERADRRPRINRRPGWEALASDPPRRLWERSRRAAVGGEPTGASPAPPPRERISARRARRYAASTDLEAPALERQRRAAPRRRGGSSLAGGWRASVTDLERCSTRAYCLWAFQGSWTLSQWTLGFEMSERLSLYVPVAVLTLRNRRSALGERRSASD